MSSFTNKLVVFTGISLAVIFTGQWIASGKGMGKVAAKFEHSLRMAVKDDPRFQKLEFEGVGWSGYGHPFYICVKGAVQSRADWMALSNLVHEANPPVEVNIWWILIEEENAPIGQ